MRIREQSDEGQNLMLWCFVAVTQTLLYLLFLVLCFDECHSVITFINVPHCPDRSYHSWVVCHCCQTIFFLNLF